MRDNRLMWFRDCNRKEYQAAYSLARHNFNKGRPMLCRTPAQSMAIETMMNRICGNRVDVKGGPKGELP